MSDRLRGIVDGSGLALGTCVGADVREKLDRLVAMILADALGTPTDFLDHPTTYVKVSHSGVTGPVDLLYVTIDPMAHRVRLYVRDLVDETLEPLFEPRFRLARKVRAFVEAVAARRSIVAGERAGPHRARRLPPAACCAECPGSCFVMEPEGVEVAAIAPPSC